MARELRSNSFPHFSFSSAQLHDVWLGGASVLGSHLAGEPSAGAYVFALRGRFRISYTPSDFTCRYSILDMAMAWY